MTITQHEAPTGDTERRLERVEQFAIYLSRRLHTIAETTTRTDATVTQVAWTLDRLMGALDIDKEAK